LPGWPSPGRLPIDVMGQDRTTPEAAAAAFRTGRLRRHLSAGRIVDDLRVARHPIA
jgi:hypothetical protein